MGVVGYVFCGKDKRIFGEDARSLKSQPFLLLLPCLCRRPRLLVLSFGIGDYPALSHAWPWHFSLPA